VRPASEGRLPLHRTLDALAEWERSPDRATLGGLRHAFEALVRANGAEGAYLEVDAPPLPALRLGIGALRRRPPEGAPEVDEFAITSRARARRLGTLWLAGGGERRASAARAIEVAIDAAWSRAGAREMVEQMAALGEATRAIAGVLSLPQVLQLIVDRVRDLARARYAALGIVGPDGLIERFFTSGLSDEERRRIGPLPRGRGLLGLIIREDRALRVADIAGHAQHFGFPPHHPVMTTFLGVPVTVKGRSIGNLYLTDKLGGAPFTQDDEDLVRNFALHAGIAIENARLHEDVQRLAVVEERDRIGRDLHDGIIQSLYGVGLSLEDLPELMDEAPDEAKARVERAIEALHGAIGEMRNFIFGLRPELLPRAGLAAGIAALADEFRVNTLIEVELDLDRADTDGMAADRAVEVLQIAREALSNVARHARATAVRIVLARTGEALRLVIADNGDGFRPDEPRPSSHQGLANMRRRATGLGARLRIESRIGRGTRVELRVPLAAAEARATEGMTA
jgi:signal transduction histidine kinase